MKIKQIAALLSMFLLGSGFSFKLGAQSFSVTHNFTGSPDGAFPVSMVLNGGALIGVTGGGGALGSGSVFTCSTNGTGFSLLYSFANSPDGAIPNEVLLSGGILYGTTQSGGTNNWGTVFKLNANGTGYSVLHVFKGNPDGFSPFAGLVTDGTTLYGTTSSGGSGNSGTVFRMDINGGNFTVLHSFMSAPDGLNPYAGLTLSGTNLYGTTYNGGLYGVGTVFKMATNGQAYSVIYNFSNAPDANYPEGGLLVLSNYIYGTTSQGGNSNSGTIFKLGTNGGALTILHHFTGPTSAVTNSDGGAPMARLFLSNGMLYGGTTIGGIASGSSGTIFRISTNGSGFTTLKHMNLSADGGINKAGMVVDNNYLFGAANFGGSGNGGTLFQLLFAPTITTQPHDLTVASGGSASFTVVAADESALSYQWYFNTNTLLAGQVSSTINLAAVNGGNAGAYTVAVADGFGTVTSSPAVLTVSASAVSPTITAQPQPQNVTNGNPANFSVSATGTAPLAYQWYFNANTGNAALLGTGLGGQINSTLSFTAASNNAGYYSVIVSNVAGSVTSSPALLTVVPANLNTLPGITAQPQNLNVTNGNAATFTVTATNALMYQWYFNTNSLLVGQTNNSLAINPASAINAGVYTVAVANDNGAVTSSPAVLTVYTNTKPVILLQPQSVFVTSNDIAVFSVNAVGQGPLRYQWYFNTTSNAIGTALAGQTNSSRSFTASSGNGNYYSVVITNALGKTTSSPPALLTIVMAPLIRTNPQAVTVNAGSTAAFAVSALGVSLHYQWYSNSIATALGTLLAGQTNSNFSFTSAANANGSYYSVLVTNTLGRATSSPALLTVTSAPSISITLQPLDNTITNGDAVSFTSAATGSGTLSYQWFFQTNVLIAGATSPTLSFTTANQPGRYSMKVSNGSGAVTSSPALLTVVGKPIMVSANFEAVSGSYNFSYVNLAGSANRLWASTNLADPGSWSSIATFVMPTNSLWLGTDPNTAHTNKARFYRFSTP